ncbi:MAG: F0F1 ATP synthase subunit B [Deltaproteobacteria bacterium]|nr:F0F1 ATP synthase subunit B [Deltaproteobacteria bacterium]
MNLGSKKIKLVLTAVIAGLAVAAVAYAGEHGGAHHELISHTRLVNFGWRCMNFAALVVIMVKYVIPPIGKILSDRRMAIVNQFEDLHERRTEVEKSYKECEVKLSGIGQEVDNILKTARTQAEEEKARIIGDAKRSAEDIKRKAVASVHNELSKAKQKLREDVAEQAAALAADIIRKNFSEADQTKMVEDYLEQVGAMA